LAEKGIGMNSRERVQAIVNGLPVDRCAYWTGWPHQDSRPGLFAYFRCSTAEHLYRRLGDDVRWIPVGNHPLAPKGTFADCRTVGDVDQAFQWPDPLQFDLTPWLDELAACTESYYRVSGNLSMFFHCDCFDGFGGMQRYFEMMYEHPEVVHAVTHRANDYYLKLNRRFFEVAGSRMDALMISHDLGTQLGPMLGSPTLEQFVYPFLKEQIDLGHEFGYKVLLHCCGSIVDLMPRLVELGVDLLHPIQAEARGMDAESLASHKFKLIYVGGIGTQKVLTVGSPEEVRAEVFRVAKALAPLVISPSHEALLSNIPPANVEAMAKAARECTC
jgi:uroporphyrinogen decarboxylase